LARVVIGGLVSSTLLTLIVLPALYPWFPEREEKMTMSELQLDKESHNGHHEALVSPR